MIQTIMAFFGYAKIPVAVVQLSMMQEKFLETMRTIEPEPKGKEVIAKYLDGQKTITKFLQSCRRLG